MMEKLKCKHSNAIEDAYFNCMYCEECNSYVDYEEYEKINNINIEPLKEGEE